jgi:hypothetical protein
MISVFLATSAVLLFRVGLLSPNSTSRGAIDICLKLRHGSQWRQNAVANSFDSDSRLRARNRGPGSGFRSSTSRARGSNMFGGARRQYERYIRLRMPGPKRGPDRSAELLLACRALLQGNERCGRIGSIKASPCWSRCGCHRLPPRQSDRRSDPARSGCDTDGSQNAAIARSKIFRHGHGIDVADATAFEMT